MTKERWSLKAETWTTGPLLEIMFHHNKECFLNSSSLYEKVTAPVIRLLIVACTEWRQGSVPWSDVTDAWRGRNRDRGIGCARVSVKYQNLSLHAEAGLIKLYKQGRMRRGNNEVCELKKTLWRHEGFLWFTKWKNRQRGANGEKEEGRNQYCALKIRKPILILSFLSEIQIKYAI